MCKCNKYILLVWSVMVITATIGCTGMQVAGGGASETVALVISDNTISGSIKSDQSELSHDVVLYSSDYIPNIQSSDGKWSTSLSNDGAFEYTLDSGMYNLIVTNTSNGNSAIIQNIKLMEGKQELQEKKLVQTGSVEISLKELSPEMIYIKGTPFFTDRIENNSAKIKGVPPGLYKIGYILPKSGETYRPDSSEYFIVNSSETTFVTIHNK